MKLLRSNCFIFHKCRVAIIFTVVMILSAFIKTHNAYASGSKGYKSPVFAQGCNLSFESVDCNRVPSNGTVCANDVYTRYQRVEAAGCRKHFWEADQTACYNSLNVAARQCVNLCEIHCSKKASHASSSLGSGDGNNGSDENGVPPPAAAPEALTPAESPAAQEQAPREAQEKEQKAAPEREMNDSFADETADEKAQQQAAAALRNECTENKQAMVDNQLNDDFKNTPDFQARAAIDIERCVASGNANTYLWSVVGAREASNEKDFRTKRADSIYKDDLRECTETHNVAAECCGSPEKCLTKPDPNDADKNSSQYGDIAKMILGTAVNFPASSVSAMCDKMKIVSNLTAGLNAYLGFRCSSYVKECKQSCEGIRAQIEKDELCKDDACDNLLGEFDFNISDCNKANNGALKMTKQAIASRVAAQYADNCKNQIQSDKSSESTADLFGDPNCTTPGAAASPICQAKCSKPGAASDPNCAGFPGLGGNQIGVSETAGNQVNGADFSNLLDDTEGMQGAVTPDVLAQGNKSTGGQGGGSGGGGLPGGGDSGGSDGGQGAAGGGAGYDTGILKGTMSGNGYSVSSMRTGGGGGFSGYGGKGGGAITSKASPFNLRDYLPGAGKSKKLATRSIASLPADISPAHANIFEKVTERFYQVCLRNGLYDCHTLNKIKRPRN